MYKVIEIDEDGNMENPNFFERFFKAIIMIVILIIIIIIIIVIICYFRIKK
jgi:hypothetical protein